MSRFRQALSSGEVLLMDGAMGTELLRAGIAEGECFEKWNISHADRVRAIHQAYADAGSQCLLTNTFQANPQALAKHGLATELRSICSAAVTLARSVAGSDRFVIGDIGPIFAGNPPQEFSDQAGLAQVVEALSGADAILLETCSDPAALQAVRWCRAVLGSREVPVLLSLSYRKDAAGALVTESGHSPEWFGERAADSGAAALGVNCGRDIGLEEILAIIRRYRGVTSLPLCARPNAGTPTRIGQQWQYPLVPAALASSLPELLEAGIALIGGCCGTNPAHVAALEPLVGEWNRGQRRRKGDANVGQVDHQPE